MQKSQLKHLKQACLLIPIDNLDISRVLSGLKPGEDTRQLNKLKQQLLSKSNVTSEAIKNIVFDHYKHFIEASRNVSGWSLF